MTTNSTSDAPERIWITFYDNGKASDFWQPEPRRPDPERDIAPFTSIPYRRVYQQSEQPEQWVKAEHESDVGCPICGRDAQACGVNEAEMPVPDVASSPLLRESRRRGHQQGVEPSLEDLAIQAADYLQKLDEEQAGYISFALRQKIADTRAHAPVAEQPCKQCGCTHATAYELGRQDERAALLDKKEG